MLRATLIGDFAVEPLHPPHDEDVHDLIAARYERSLYSCFESGSGRMG
jgi:hypothetical protein